MFPPRQQPRSGIPALLALLILTAGLAVFGQAGKRTGMQPLAGTAGSHVEWLADTTGADLSHLLNRPPSAWKSWDGKGYVCGRHGETIWQRVTLPLATERLRGVVTDTYLYSDEVECYVPNPAESGGWTKMRAGEKTPAAEKPLAGREAAFPIDLAAGKATTIYLKISDRFPCLSQLAWWPSEAQFMASRTHDVLAEGGYFGILFALLFYNVALWTRLQFPDTGRYLLYLASAGLFMFVSRNDVLVLGMTLGSPWLEMGSMLLSSLSVVFLVDFARVFLDLPSSAPRWNRVSQTLKLVMLAMAACSFALPWLRDSAIVYVALTVGPLTQLVLLGAAVAAWRNGVRQSRYFVAAFGSFMAGLLPSLRMWWWADSFEDNAAAGFAVLAGSAVEILLFSIATADRFAQIERENLAAREKLLAEAEQRKVMQEAYADELELEVRERTAELLQAGEDKDRMISVIGHDLRGPLTGLTQATEQLRRTTAGTSLDGFLSETVQTGRQLLLLIEDLVLWARLRAGSVEFASHSVATLVEPVAVLHRTVAQQRSVQLEVEVPLGLEVRTDLVLAQTLLRNLLGNALKFSRHRVSLVAIAGSEGVEFSVQDDGPGLPAEAAAPFIDDTMSPSVTRGGMGLRLCREVSAALGVRIAVSRPPEGGTRFSFVLPLAQEATAHNEQSPLVPTGSVAILSAEVCEQ